MFHPLQWRLPSSIYSCYTNSARFFGYQGKLGFWQKEKSLRGSFQWLFAWLQKSTEKCPMQTSLLSLLVSQCSYVTSQRVRRAHQIGQLYSNIYSERTRNSLFSTLWRKFQGHYGSLGKLMTAVTGVFLWEQERIKEEELKRWVFFW